MAKKLWGGRFKKEIDQDFFEFQKSIHYDYRLAVYDIYHSLIHVLALRNAGIVSLAEAKKLENALEGILKEIVFKQFKPNLDSEDIHTEIQNRIENKTGTLALKLHTLRSRNDQIAFDEKCFCSLEAQAVAEGIATLLDSLQGLSNQNPGLNLPGYTHTQRAQKISFKNYLKGFSGMLSKDKERLLDFKDKLVIYIGSGAFKGTLLTKEYGKAIKEFLKKYDITLIKIAVAHNPVDNVSDRDFIIELLSILAILQMHLSRLAEDCILYATKEFNYFELPEEFCTGSSLMPHKKNPDFLELVRGNTGRIYGNLNALLVMMKGLPLTYNRDMQLDKEPLFSSVDIIKDELKLFAQFMAGIKLNKEAIQNALEDESLYATELTEYLVTKKTPFKEAHEIVGKLIRYAEDTQCKIKDMDVSLLKKFSPYFNREVMYKVFQ